METHSLDDAYGAGTHDGFLRRCEVGSFLPGVETFITEEPTSDGTAVEIAWMKEGEQVGLYRTVWKGEEVFTSGLWIEPRWSGKGILLHLCEELNQWWAELGITRNTMIATPGRAREALEACGFTDLPSGAWGCPIPSPRFLAALPHLRKQKPSSVF